MSEVDGVQIRSERIKRNYYILESVFFDVPRDRYRL